MGLSQYIVPVRHWAESLMLTPANWRFWQFLTYAFLHDDIWHILGNMFFLYLFGRNVNDKLGNFGYTAFYLSAAVFSALGHALADLSSISPLLGASGAVAAVTGAYLVLFPQTLITVIYFFFFIGAIEVPALYFILLKMIVFDNIINRTAGHIAYGAHLAGYTYGIGLILLLLAAGLVGGSNFDLWAMVKRWNRRRRYRDAVSGGYDPFSGSSVRRSVDAHEVSGKARDPEEESQIRDLRQEISRWIAQRNLAAAADSYIQLQRIDREQILPRQHLLDVANQLASEHRHAEAAEAYEQFLTHYGSYEHSEQVELMLGILYARYLRQPDKAVGHLQHAADRLSDPGQSKMCREELARLGQ
jgi:membrane associated rhomboid family serine protease